MRPHLALNRAHDVGMAVAEDGAHLAGGEVQDGAAVGIIDKAALGPLDDDRLESGP
jgi:hypothetical protein